MREIKFRQRIRAVGSSPAYWYYWGYTSEGIFIAPLGPMDVDPNHKESQQYVGMHNDKGQAIYQGDLVRLKGNAFVNHEVYWDERSFQYRLCAVHITDKQIDKTHLLDFAKTGEVIGNIYENPELV